MAKQLAAITLICMSFAFVLFWRDVRQSAATPALWPWLIRVLGAIALLVSQLSLGATFSLALSGGQSAMGLVMVGVICFYARPFNASLSVMDRIMLGVALAGLVLVCAGLPVISMVGIIVADACATFMSMRATWWHGRRESTGFWSFCLIAALASTIVAAQSQSASAWILLPPLFSTCNALVNILAAQLMPRREAVSVDG